MKRFISALALLGVFGLAVAGCGGDDDDDSGAGGSSGTGATSSTAGQPDSSNGGGDTSGNVMCDPEAATACQNDMDCPFVIDGTARITAGMCGQGCVGNSDENCSRDCITDMLKMSADCATCYADTVNCTIKNCLGDCIADPEADKCKQCQVDQGCRSDFDDCSGLPG
jgi:hypothetical protein